MNKTKKQQCSTGFFSSIACFFSNTFNVLGAALRASFNFKYWFIAGLGGIIASFIVVSFYYVSVKLQLSELFYLGFLVAILPIAWSFGEIASAERRKLATGQSLSFNQIINQFGNGRRTVVVMMKYLFLLLVFLAFQIGLSYLIDVPKYGTVLYSIVAVPIVIFTFFSFFSLVLVLFGLSVFPAHILYDVPSHEKGVFKRILKDAKELLKIIRALFWRIVFTIIPAFVIGSVLTMIPLAIIGSAFYLSLVTTGKSSAFLTTIKLLPQKVSLFVDSFVSGKLDPIGTVTAVIGSISLAHILGVIFSLFVSFLATLFFHIYEQKYIDPEVAMMDTLNKDFSPVAIGALGDFTPNDGLEDFSPSGDNFAVGGKNYSAAPSIFSDDYDSETTSDDVEAFDPLYDKLLSQDDISDFSDLTLDNFNTNDGNLTLDDLNGSSDEFSGDNILSSIESTMDISEESGDSISLDDLNVPKDEFSGDDILSSIESTMDIEDDDPLGTEGINDTDLGQEIDNIISSIDDDLGTEDVGTDLIADPNVSLTSDELEQDSGKLSDLDLDLAQDNAIFDEKGPEVTVIDGSLDELLDVAVSGEASPTSVPLDDLSSSDDLNDFAGMDESLEDLLGDGSSASVDGSAPAPIDDLTNMDESLEDLLGANNIVSTETVAPLDDLTNMDESLADLLGDGSSASVDGSAPAPIDDLTNMDESLDDLLVNAPVVAESTLEPLSGSIKGVLNNYTYLASIKNDSVLFVGVKGSPTTEKMDYSVDVTFTNGEVVNEIVSIPSVNDKGIGFSKVDLTDYISNQGFGQVANLQVNAI